jgi:hypothetical protein
LDDKDKNVIINDKEKEESKKKVLRLGKLNNFFFISIIKK